MTIKSLVSAFVLLVCVAASPVAAQTITAPTGGANAVKAANDFATRAFQDPWDMSQRTDVGWWLFGTDNAASTVNWTNLSFANGLFSGTAGASAGLFLLESGLMEPPGDPAAPIGKTGKNYPINASQFTHLVYRMSSSQTGVSQYIWSSKTIYDGQTIAFEQNQSATAVAQGWKLYDVSLPALSRIGTDTWSGTIRALQFLPNVASSNAQIQLDWVRLVEDDASLYRDITWTGTSPVDIYLDNNANPADGTLGRIAVNTTGNISTRTYRFFAGSLEPGDYYVVMHAPTANEVTNGTGFSTTSTGFYRVNAIPTLNFTTPSDEGSADDFATAKLGNPWDFKSMLDIDYRAQIQNESITSLDLMTEAGVSLPGQTVYLATSTPAASGNVGDPFLFPLFWDYRGKVTRIDPARYRILTVDMGIPNLARSLPGGSIGRVVWRAVNEPVRGADNVQVQTVGQAWVVNHKLGENTLAHVTVDMKSMPVEPGSPGKTAWSSADAIDAFRFDPHEFSNPTQFFMKKIKIASLERTASGQLTFRWNYSKSSGTVDLYREPAASSTKSFNAGVKINGSAIQATAGSYTWESTGTPDGEYQIYAIFTDGTNSNQVYAPTPIVVDANNIALPMFVLDRSTLTFGALGPIRTPAQTVRLTFSGPGSQCWSASSNHPGVAISPSSGTGATNLLISIPGSFAGGTTNALITLTSCSSVQNSRVISVTVRAMNTSAPPSGALDTPVDGQTVAGSIAVTGWAVDDIGVGRVTVCRDAVAGEGTPPQPSCGGAGRIYIGDGTFVEDARPDIETMSPTSPASYKAGWGYLMLTNFLPDQGNGTFKIYAYAYDVEGYNTLIGSKTIVAQNASAIKPFGALDTPGQGEVICGTYINFGWALTRPPFTIPSNSSTITVYIDNVPVGSPGTLSARPDIQTLFPTGYNDPNHAVGGYIFDTTQYSNGVHSIFWLVTDTAGQQDGIGSRFFTIANPCTGS
jgi:hypothetical protein